MFEFRLTVRGYELDSYGHVNNAVYLNYFEQARWEVLRENGLISIFREKDLFLVVTELKIRYSQEARLFDELIIQTRMYREGPYILFRHKMTNAASGLKVASSDVKTLVIDKERTPQSVPREFDHLFEKPASL